MFSPKVNEVQRSVASLRRLVAEEKRAMNPTIKERKKKMDSLIHEYEKNSVSENTDEYQLNKLTQDEHGMIIEERSFLLSNDGQEHYRKFGALGKKNKKSGYIQLGNQNSDTSFHTKSITTPKSRLTGVNTKGVVSSRSRSRSPDNDDDPDFSQSSYSISQESERRREETNTVPLLDARTVTMLVEGTKQVELANGKRETLPLSFEKQQINAMHAQQDVERLKQLESAIRSRDSSTSRCDSISAFVAPSSDQAQS